MREPTTTKVSMVHGEFNIEQVCAWEGINEGWGDAVKVILESILEILL